MPIDLAHSIDSVSSYIFGGSTLRTFLGGTVIFSFIIALTMILIVMLQYPSNGNTSAGMLFKIFLYMFASSTVLLYLHDGVVRCLLKYDKNSAQASELVGHGVTNRDTIYGNYEVMLPNEIDNIERDWQAEVEQEAQRPFDPTSREHVGPPINEHSTGDIAVTEMPKPPPMPSNPFQDQVAVN